MRAASDRSNIARNRPELRGRAVGKIEHDLVDVAPAPAFRRIIAFDHRMAGGVEMFGGVTVGRAVAAAHVPAGAAQPQVHPARSCLEAFLAAARAGRHVANLVGVETCGHHALPVGTISAGRVPASAKNACSAATAWAPSPTAAATRLVEPARTSPMATTPRTLVSSGRPASLPVKTKPLRSSATPEPLSQSVLRPAPMNRNRWRSGR